MAISPRSLELPTGNTYLVQELRHVVDIVVNDEPGGFVRVVGFNFRQRVGFHFRRHSGHFCTLDPAGDDEDD